MNLRVTGQAQTAATLVQIRRQAASQAKYQDQISTGDRVKVASDDPAAYASLSQSKAASGAFANSLQVVSTATSGLDASVSALLDGNQVLTRAKQLAITGADASTDSSNFEGLATELDSLIDRFTQAANTQFDGDYLFGGDNTKSQPFRATGTNGQGRPTAVTYDGSATPAQTVIGGNQTVETRAVGSNTFSGAFDTLIQLRDTFRDKTLTDAQKATAINQSIAKIDTASSALNNTISVQSSTLSGLDAVQNRLQDLKLAADTRVGDLGATDYADAVLHLKEQESAYQSTLSLAANFVPPSLFDFIK
ncbi:flagellin N-terminal helical domain-containing protein [Limnoglobus roseus]|uniref:Flagellar hook-associated protein 3 n=1 Tax=Limnoglobus roseus TaxID=2598579 RepID=A0A5C1A6F0_9BACT|nr:hypothetical protein [Limnoglobus roseus]QEL13797.1 Flagellar hook-associated protein 3 [Limnoglobus roseus]